MYFSSFFMLSFMSKCVLRDSIHLVNPVQTAMQCIASLSSDETLVTQYTAYVDLQAGLAAAGKDPQAAERREETRAPMPSQCRRQRRPAQALTCPWPPPPPSPPPPLSLAPPSPSPPSPPTSFMLVERGMLLPRV